MDYKLFNAEEFAADESFINYYLKKDEIAVAHWTNWISRHPEKLDEVLNAERLLATMYLMPTAEDLDHAFSRFNNFMDDTAKEHQQGSPVDFDAASRSGAYFKLLNFRTAGIAASMVLLISIGLLYFSRRPAAIAKTEYVTVRNDYGRIKILSLTDGTQVYLNANSSLTYPKHFDAARREVTLSGEALFEVARDKARPFTVNANGTKTRVLGTQFNVNAYNKQQTTVALLEGSVAFESGRIKKYLKPLEMVTYTKSTNQVKLSSFNAGNVTAWTAGIILFDHASFADVAAKLKNNYGIELKDNSLAGEWNYSGQFKKTGYLTIIQSICFAKNLSYKQNNHIITLNNK